MSESDLERFRRRSGEERVAALGTKDAKVKAAHNRLADQYDRVVESYTRLGQLTGKPPA